MAAAPGGQAQGGAGEEGEEGEEGGGDPVVLVEDGGQADSRRGVGTHHVERERHPVQHGARLPGPLAALIVNCR
ncbi:hypothetical protein Kpho01_59870 [Kitasatospora phosalacinea]|uniref:Uncharacterized protein n=1 Tax=Kitasatospora phosalacinea TaxID=2065 RepID=A0A9W6PND8_9ACTN|nr:hypothetical protein Kpho01_59870 [Kitasatospora phosalacinea]